MKLTTESTEKHGDLMFFEKNLVVFLSIKDFLCELCVLRGKKIMLIHVEPKYIAPIGSDGLPMEKFDWYIGIAPTAEDFVQKQISAIENAVRILEPDGVFMSFTR